MVRIGMLSLECVFLIAFVIFFNIRLIKTGTVYDQMISIIRLNYAEKCNLKNGIINDSK